MHDESAFPHPPDLHPPEPSFWENPLLPQGLGLSGIAAVALLVLVAAFRKNAVLGLLSAPLFGGVSFLAAWAAAIHLTGGEKFDDHPWV